MALYKCKHPKCRGHHTFSASCPEPIAQDYAPLHDFIEMLETQPMKAISPELLEDTTPAPAAPSASAPSGELKDYMKFWRE